jgi:hypothetical protein
LGSRIKIDSNWGLEKISTIDAADCCSDRVQDGILGHLEFGNAKVCRTLIKSEANDKAFAMKCC